MVLRRAVAGLSSDALGDTPSLEMIAGSWSSDVRETVKGPMRFVFDFSPASNLEVIGTWVANSEEGFYRQGPFRIEGNQLISPAFNDGEPILLSVEYPRIRLRFGNGVEFVLNRTSEGNNPLRLPK